MRPLLVPVCFAAAAAFAADLKDPAAVARDWDQAVDRARQPLATSPNLLGQSDALTTPPLERAFSADAPPPPRTPRLPESLYDAPFYRAPRNLPKERPRGAVPWEYNGQVYWLVPLGPPAKE